MTSLTKIQNPKPKKNFSLQTARQAESFGGFDQLSSTFGAGIMLMQSHVPTGCFRANRLN